MPFSIIFGLLKSESTDSAEKPVRILDHERRTIGDFDTFRKRSFFFTRIMKL